jgi:hypothetical protein
MILPGKMRNTPVQEKDSKTAGYSAHGVHRFGSGQRVIAEKQ